MELLTVFKVNTLRHLRLAQFSCFSFLFFFLQYADSLSQKAALAAVRNAGAKN